MPKTIDEYAKKLKYIIVYFI